MFELSDDHIRLYKSIKSFWHSNGYAPSYRNLIDATAIGSMSKLIRLLHDLKRAGYIDYQCSVARSIKLC